MPASPLIHIIRHGQALHNVDRGYPHRDPPLTDAGENATRNTKLPTNPDLVIISPMTRAIQTAQNVFPSLQESGSAPIPAQIWPDLREAHDAICNKGISRAELQVKFAQFDFSECSEEWNYPDHSVEDATIRAERVRLRLKELSKTYKNIAIVTHRGFIAFLTRGRRFDVCETRTYRFATKEEVQINESRMGLNCDTLQEQDFGPTLLVLQASQDHADFPQEPNSFVKTSTARISR